MWTLKTVKTFMNTEAKVPGERLMMHVEAVVTDNEKDVTVPFTIESKELMDKTLISIVERMNKTEADVQATPNGEAYTPVVPEKPVEPLPTPVEVALQLFQQRRAEIKAQLLELKQDVEVGLATQAEFDAALVKAKVWLNKNKLA